MGRQFCMLSLFSLLSLGSCTTAQSNLSITHANGLKVMVLNQNFPLLKLLLPNQSNTERGIEIEFPEHVTGLNERTRQSEHLYLVTQGNRNKRTLPVWRIEGNTLVYETKLDGLITMTAIARLEPDGLRYTYSFSNHSTESFQNLQAVTCVKLYSAFADTLLQRTYVHHADGFELLAAETPARLSMPMQKWLPCRYLVSYTWPVSPRRIEKDEDSITRYHKSRKVDKPFMATISRDKKWIAATYTKETGNLWTNPERSCHHADPAVNLYPGQTKSLELKTFIVKNELEQLLNLVNAEMKKD